MTQIRTGRFAEGRVTVLSNELLQDFSISSQTRGVIGSALSFPPDWHWTAEELAKVLPEGLSTIKKCLREATKAGYLKRTRLKKPDGSWEWTWDLRDQRFHTPAPDSPWVKNQPMVPPAETGESPGRTMGYITTDGDVTDIPKDDLPKEYEEKNRSSSVASVGSSVQVRNARGDDEAPPARPGKPESSSGLPSRQAWDVFAALPPAWRKCPQWVRKLFAAEIDEALPKYGAERITAAVAQYAPEPGDLIGAGLTREDADKHLRAFKKVLSFAHSDMLAGDSPSDDHPGAVNTGSGGLPDWLALADDACAQCGKSTDDVTLCLELPIPTPLCAPHYSQTLAELTA